MRFLLGMTAVICLASTLVACTMAPKYERPSPQLHSDWAAGGMPQVQANATQPGWRDVIEDSSTRHLVELALVNNRDLRMAALRIEKAQAQYQIQRADLFPKIDAGAGANMQRTPASLSPTGLPITTRAYSVGLGFSAFELDFFGRIQSLRGAALEQFLATEVSHRSTELSLVAQVATGYCALAADREHLKLAKDILQTEQASYELVRQRYELGTVSRLDLSQAQTTVDTARVSVAVYAAQVNADENILELLVGMPLSQELLPAQSLADIAPLRPVPAGLPSEVLTRRPDVLAAEHQLKAANANIGAARAMHFPIISLTGSYGTASNEVRDLFRNGFQAWTFIPQVALPIFHAGAISAGVKVAEADKAIMVAQYEKTVQAAFREVSDSLAQEASLTDQVEALASLSNATGEASELTNQLYESGIGSYLSRLDAQRVHATTRQNLISVHMARLANTLTLYKALGGAWTSE